MLKHYVMWNIREEALRRDVDEAILRLLELKSLNEVLDLKVEKSNCSSSSKDIILIVTCLTEKDLNTYLKDPLHIEISEFIHKVFTNKEVLDIDG
ncbi:MAG: Dabb family protein [Erysipelotrichaceae bacterium]